MSPPRDNTKKGIGRIDSGRCLFQKRLQTTGAYPTIATACIRRQPHYNIRSRRPLLTQAALYVLDTQLSRNSPAIVVLNDRIADIDRMAAANPFVLRRLLERYRLKSRIGLLALHQIHTQVLKLRSHKANLSMAAHTARQEYRCRIPRPEGLETAQIMPELKRNVAEQQLRVYVNLRHQHLRIDVRLNIFVEPSGVNSPIFSGRIVNPAAYMCPPKFSSRSEHDSTAW